MIRRLRALDPRLRAWALASALGLLATPVASAGAVAAVSAFAAAGAVDSGARPEAEPAPGEGPVAEVEVSGERAGPRLWRISKGDHVVWLLGTLDPLPRRMTWKSREVEGVLAQAQQVLASSPSVSASIGPILAIRLYMQYRRTEKIPEKSNLRAWLPPPLYQRFTTLKLRYDPHDQRIEELRPLFAARRLYERALDDSGLTSSDLIQSSVLELARKHHVKVVRTAVRLEDPRGVLTEVGEIPRAAEIDCLAATVERIENDLGPMQARARAWALGDVDALRALPFPSQRQVCLDAVATGPRLKALIDRANDDWNAALETALRENQTTLAMRSMYEVLGPTGVLARLRARGYTVEGP
jgi:uncharacterized protein YbaP (TraB family)